MLQCNDHSFKGYCWAFVLALYRFETLSRIPPKQGEHTDNGGWIKLSLLKSWMSISYCDIASKVEMSARNEVKEKENKTKSKHVPAGEKRGLVAHPFK